MENRILMWSRFLWFLATLHFACGMQYVPLYRGVPGQDFPVFHFVPPTTFSCPSNPSGERQYFADPQTGCQVFHACDDSGKDSFICSPGTLFSEKKNACDFWYKVNCPPVLHRSQDSASSKENNSKFRRPLWNSLLSKFTIPPSQEPCVDLTTTEPTPSTQRPTTPCPTKPTTPSTPKPTTPCPTTPKPTTPCPTTPEPTTPCPTKPTTPYPTRPTTPSTPKPTTPCPTKPTTPSTPKPTTSTQKPTTPCPTTPSTPKPTTPSTPKPTTPSTPKPTTPCPTTPSTPRPTTRSTPRPTTRSTPRPTTRSTPRPTTRSTPRPTTRSTPRPTTRSTPRPTTPSTPKPTTPCPTTPSTPKPTTPSTPKPTTPSTPKPTTPSTPKPTTPCPTKPTTPKPTTPSTPKPTTPSTPKPTTPCPTTPSTPKPTTPSTPEPTTPSTPKPTTPSTPKPTTPSTPNPTTPCPTKPTPSTQKPTTPCPSKPTTPDVTSASTPCPHSQKPTTRPRGRQIVNNIQVHVNAEPRIKTNTYVLVLKDGNSVELIPVNPNEARFSRNTPGFVHLSYSTNDSNNITVNKSLAENDLNTTHILTKREIHDGYRGSHFGGHASSMNFFGQGSLDPQRANASPLEMEISRLLDKIRPNTAFIKIQPENSRRKRAIHELAEVIVPEQIYRLLSKNSHFSQRGLHSSKTPLTQFLRAAMKRIKDHGIRTNEMEMK